MLNNQLENTQNEALINVVNENSKSILNLENNQLPSMLIKLYGSTDTMEALGILPTMISDPINPISITIPLCYFNYFKPYDDDSPYCYFGIYNGDVNQYVLVFHMNVKLKKEINTVNKWLLLLSDEFIKTKHRSYTNDLNSYKITPSGLYLKTDKAVTVNTTFNIETSIIIPWTDAIYLRSDPSYISQGVHIDIDTALRHLCKIATIYNGFHLSDAMTIINLNQISKSNDWIQIFDNKTMYSVESIVLLDEVYVVFDAIPYGDFRCDPTGLYIKINKDIQKLYGIAINLDALVGKLRVNINTIMQYM